MCNLNCGEHKQIRNLVFATVGKNSYGQVIAGYLPYNLNGSGIVIERSTNITRLARILAGLQLSKITATDVNTDDRRLFAVNNCEVFLRDDIIKRGLDQISVTPDVLKII